MKRCKVCQFPLRLTHSREDRKYCSRGKEPRPGSGLPTSCRRLRVHLTHAERRRSA